MADYADSDWCIPCHVPIGLGHCSECIREAKSLYAIPDEVNYHEECGVCGGSGLRSIDWFGDGRWVERHCHHCNGRGFVVDVTSDS